MAEDQAIGTTHAEQTGHDHERDYEALRMAIGQSFAVASGRSGRLFRTDADLLWDVYFAGLPAEERQVHNCRACRHFIHRYGGLAEIDDDGTLIAACWSPEAVPPVYRDVVTDLAWIVRRARVTGLFYANEPVLGTPNTGTWSHFFALADRLLVEDPRAVAAAKTGNFVAVAAYLARVSENALGQALRLLTTQSLPRPERFVAPLQWLIDLKTQRAAERNARIRDNLLWAAIAHAPEGYCHPAASVLGKLIEDIQEGKPYAAVRAAFVAAVDPARYQRPQVAPSAGNIAGAERRIEELGLAPALARRFARLDEVETIWRPRSVSDPAETPGKVFGHLKPKEARTEAKPLTIPAATMTWVKFASIIMPDAEAMELQLPEIGAYIALVTAVDPAAPPLLKWDRPQERNPVSWFVYPDGSATRAWSLRPGFWPVSAIAPLPTLWGHRPMPFLGEGVVLVLDGAQRTEDVSLALFPEILRDELHEVRATIEAYSKSRFLEGREGASACGWDLRKNRLGGFPATLRVLNPTGWTVYRIDRWD